MGVPFFKTARQAGVQDRWEAVKDMTNAQALSGAVGEIPLSN